MKALLSSHSGAVILKYSVYRDVLSFVFNFFLFHIDESLMSDRVIPELDVARGCHGACDWSDWSASEIDMGVWMGVGE